MNFRTTLYCSLLLLTLNASTSAQGTVAQEAYLKASVSNGGDHLGEAVAISGDTIVVGASSERSAATGVNGDAADNTVQLSGAVYVFVRDSSGWLQQAYLKASNTGSFDRFGWSTAISGDTIVIGAPHEGSNATGVNGDESDSSPGLFGAAYVFVRSGSTWSQQAYLKASNTGVQPAFGGGDRFGTSVAVFGDTIVVGAPGEDSSASGINGNQDDESLRDSGAVYVFTRSGTTWSQEAYIKPSNPDSLDAFGGAVAVSGDTISVGAVGEDSFATGVNGDPFNDVMSSFDSGAAYVFVRSGTTWSQEAYLKAAVIDGNDQFGYSVAVDANTIAVGAWKEDSNATVVDGDAMNNMRNGAGAAYVFARSGTTWNQQAYLKASNTNAQDEFGESVAVSGNRVLVGASAEDGQGSGVDCGEGDNSAGYSGAAYLYVRTGSAWNQHAYTKASNSNVSDRFGRAVGISGETAVVGALGEDSNATIVGGDQLNNSSLSTGASYVYDLDYMPPLPAGIDFCSGDGGDQMGCTNCPCGNNALAGTIGGCLNSASGSARLHATGNRSVTLPTGSVGDLRFSLTGAPPGAFCILNSGDGVAPGNPINMCFGQNSGVQATQFDGLRCAIINTRRHGGRVANWCGDVGLDGRPWGGEGGPPVGIAVAGGGFAAGQTRYFQIINRDDPLLSCMRALNTSQAVEITFTP